MAWKDAAFTYRGYKLKRSIGRLLLDYKRSVEVSQSPEDIQFLKEKAEALEKELLEIAADALN